jgi:hypothetical protein
MVALAQAVEDVAPEGLLTYLSPREDVVDVEG